MAMWRMNGLWRRMAGVLVLCALLLSNEVTCQEEGETVPTASNPTADPSAATDAAGSAAPGTTVAPGGNAAATVAGGEDSASAVSSQRSSFPATTVTIRILPDNQDGDASGTSGTTVGLGGRGDAVAPVEVQDDARIVNLVVPHVKCVGEGDISENNGVQVEVATTDCEATKSIIQANPASWCNKQECKLKIFQKDRTALVASDDAKLSALADTLQSEPLKNMLGVTKVEAPSSSSSGSSVFVGILVSGLLAALAITLGYFKCQRRGDPKGVRLAEEAYPVDQDNQGNTLVSVAPLNPPAETQEKPSVNGESPEAAKTQPPPPTNGHSTTKTADTEL